MLLPVVKNEHYMTIHSYNVTTASRHEETTTLPTIKIH
jgi:hypothetical protein